MGAKAYRTLKKHGVDLNVDLNALQKKYDGLRTSHADLKERLAAVNEELKPMKDIRYWVGKVLSTEQAVEKQPEPKHSLKERLQYEQAESQKKQEQKKSAAQKTEYGALTGTCRFRKKQKMHPDNRVHFLISQRDRYDFRFWQASVQADHSRSDR